MKNFSILIMIAVLALFANTSSATDRLVPSVYPTIQDAVTAALPGDNIIIAAGTYTLPVQVLLNKANITITGAGNTSTIIQVSGTGERFYISATGVTIKDLQIQKTDKIGVQNIIYIGASNTTIKNNIIFGQFVIGEGDVSRAMVITGGLTGLQIEGNTIYSLRQPAYMSGPTTGNILNNYVYLTKGWVMEGGDVTFTGNTWGTGVNSNVYDIAILSLAPPTAYTDIVAMSNANNGAVIEDQRVSPAVLSVVYVDASTSFTTDLGGRYHPYSSITPAITRVATGGKILVAAGTYTEPAQLDLNKSLNLIGSGSATTIIKPGSNTTNGGNVKSESFIYIDPIATVVIKNFKIDCLGKQINHAIQSRGALTVEDCIIQNVKFAKYFGRGIVFFKGSSNLVKNTSFSNIERIGIHIRGNVEATNPTVAIDNVTYLGKGAGDWLDYGVEFGGGGMGTVNKLTVSNCKGIALSDGSTSAGILITDYWGTGTNATITNSVLTGNEAGIAAGYNSTDNSVVVAHNNNISSNISYGILSVHPAVNATNNWWGTSTGPYHVTLNPTGTGNAVSDYVTFSPWLMNTMVGTDINIPVSVTPAPIPLPNCGGTIQFNNLGSNNVNPTITIEKYLGYAGTPTSAGAPIPVYFKITATNLINYTFEATLVFDVSGFAEFNANTVVMFSSNGTNWVGGNGTYNAGTQTYTFTTNHFSYVAFTNPLLSNEINLYVSTSTTGYSNTVYPNIGWNTPLSTGSGDAFNWTPLAANHDWTYKVKNGTFYIIPNGVRTFNVATIKLIWNPSIISGLSVTEGNFFNNGGQPSIFTTNRGSNWVIIDASCLTQNQTPDGIKYIAQLDFAFNGTESGFSPVSVDAATLLYMDGNNEYEVTTVTQDMGGKMKSYLGDFASASPSSQDVGDGLITGTDLTGFSSAYWSSYTSPSVYRSKYDVGPTTPVRYYFGKPTPDGTIGFEDLAIFAMGYSKTASGTLPDNPKPILFSLDKIQKEANGTIKLPVRISGSVNDVRAYSMKLNYSSDMEYTGVEMAGEVLEGTNFLIGKNETGKVYTDGASFGKSLSKEGIIAYVLFTEKTAGNHYANIESVIARNSGNLDLEVSFAGSNNGVGVPKTFGLNQNYPNPFNPVTKIEYAVPTDVKVTIKVYDLLGREVSILVNEVKKVGYYSVDWNGSSLSSGIYFYQMNAGDYVAVKKMMLIK